MIFPDEWNVYEVGGYIRDRILGIESKDIDFAVEGPQSLAGMETRLKDLGFDVFKVDEGTYTARARFPRDDDTYGGLAADFVLCRKEGPYSDGRHPDWVEIGDIYDDLARRDFTVNAMAQSVEGGWLIDPHDGMQDLDDRLLRFVGVAQDRITEDALRVVRGLRFMVTKGLVASPATWAAMTSEETAERLSNDDIISIERVRDELHRMFKTNTLQSLALLDSLPGHTYHAIMRDGLWLEPTLKGQ